MASTDVECVFSHGSLVVSKHHHNLSAESIQANVVLNSWSKIDELIPWKELIKQFNEKAHCKSTEEVEVVGDESAELDLSDDDEDIPEEQ